MAWIHIPSIRLTFSPVTADSSLGFDSLGSPSEPSAMSNGTSTASKSCSNDSKMTHPRLLPRRSGTISNPLTDDPGVKSWISSLLASRANPTQTPDSAGAPTMTGTSGPIPSESLGRWDQNASSWRTCQGSLWDLMDGNHMGALWSESWPTQGMTRSGELFPLPTQAHRTSANGGGWWPTPNTRDTRRGCNQRQLATEVDKWHIPTPTSADVYTGNLESSQQSDDSMHSVSLPDFVHRWPTPTSTERSGTNPNTGKGEGLSKTVKMFPTPSAQEPGWKNIELVDGHGCSPPCHPNQRFYDKNTGRLVQKGLPQMAMFPTPRAGKTTDEDEESWLARHADGKVATPPLALAARMLPTPNASDAKGANMKDGHDVDRGYLRGVVNRLPTPSSGGESGGPHGIRGGSWAKAKLVETFGEEQAVAMSGGDLSPDWVSWLMGLPIGWTSLEPLAQEDYDEWFQAQRDGTWWQEERGLPRIATGIKDRVNRLKCLGNGIVPSCLALFLR